MVGENENYAFAYRYNSYQEKSHYHKTMDSMVLAVWRQEGRKIILNDDISGCVDILIAKSLYLASETAAHWSKLYFHGFIMLAGVSWVDHYLWDFHSCI